MILTSNTNQDGPYRKFTDLLPFSLNFGCDHRNNDLCWNIELNGICHKDAKGIQNFHCLI